jgi:hypothetical protein
VHYAVHKEVTNLVVVHSLGSRVGMLGALELSVMIYCVLSVPWHMFEDSWNQGDNHSRCTYCGLLFTLSSTQKFRNVLSVFPMVYRLSDYL